MILEDIPHENDLRRIVYNMYHYKKLLVIADKIYMTNSKGRNKKEVVLSSEETEFIKNVIADYEDDSKYGNMSFDRYRQEVEVYT